MTTKHTVEPWDICDSANSTFIHIETADALQIATVNRGHRDERLANALRIVACVNACAGLADPSVVPEMLEALKEILQRLDAAHAHECVGWDCAICGPMAASQLQGLIQSKIARAEGRKA